MKTLELRLPDEFDFKEHDFLMLIASNLYAEGKLSAGQAAKVAKLSKRAFVELLGRYGVSLFSTSMFDLKSDISNA